MNHILYAIIKSRLLRHLVATWDRTGHYSSKFLNQGRSVTLQRVLRQDRWREPADKNPSRIKTVIRDVRFNTTFIKIYEQEEAAEAKAAA